MGIPSTRIFTFCPDIPCNDMKVPSTLSWLSLILSSFFKTSPKLTAASASIFSRFITLILLTAFSFEVSSYCAVITKVSSTLSSWLNPK